MAQTTKIDLDQSSQADPKQQASETTKVSLKEEPKIMQPLEGQKTSAQPKYFYPVMIAVILIGLASGFFFAKHRLLLAGDKTGSSTNLSSTAGSDLKKGQVFGADAEDTFSDQAEGIIQPGGIGGEGSHHLERGDNESQWVYITSSVIDLDQFVGSKVEVWGETFQGKKAGWLMDVGRLKVVEPQAAEINDIEASPE